ncbi:MAG TPA: TIGR03790 family protein [Sandaracinaceae bacterium LLY-WYZ-13_1]|nr:TIGR03790 family protein [Sandaracinaceae bacterium LLY-WYZ-13_1]
MRRASLCVLFCALLAPSAAAATPGPDTVAVVGNANVPESVALAERYAEARDVPANQVCLLDVEDVETVSLEAYRTDFLEPLRTCLDGGGARERIEAVLLVRGVPLRVTVPDGGDRPVSLAAALMLWDSEMEADGAPLLGQPSGREAMCGSATCYAARWSNPYSGLPFEPGWEITRAGVVWRPILVTMLHGRSYEDAERLLDSALAATADDLKGGELLFMDGSDAARGALDFQYDGVIADLTDRGFTATRVPFDANLTGRDLSTFVTGTANLGETIEGNTFRAGSLVDNLTSFGAVPRNFRESGESQVSVARWVAKGVGGVHGTVAEPLNNCFPQRDFLVEYADGATLAEAFHARMPYVYWRNLVLGDPMLAPFALRPQLTVTGVEDGASVDGAIPLTVDAVDPGDRGVASIVAYLDGVEVARAEGDRLEACVVIDGGADHQLLVVARAAEDPTGARPYQPKGWAAFDLASDGEATACAAPDAGVPADDASAPDRDGGVGGPDGGTTSDGEGCSCAAPGRPRDVPAGPPLALLAIAALAWRRRSARGRQAS